MMNKDETKEWITKFFSLLVDEKPEVEIKELIVKIGEKELNKGWTAIVSFKNQKNIAILIGKRGKTARKLDDIVKFLSRFKETNIRLFITP